MVARCAAVAALFAAAATAAASRTTPPAARTVSAGRYVLTGTAHADVNVLPRREYALDVLALVAPDDQRGRVVMHLWTRGYACELRGRVRAGGALTVDAGQVCRIRLDDPQRRGSFEAKVRDGSGRLDDRELALRLDMIVTGSATLSPGGSVTVPGTSVPLPLPDVPAVPVDGAVHAEAHGPRER